MVPGVTIQVMDCIQMCRCSNSGYNSTTSVVFREYVPDGCKTRRGDYSLNLGESVRESGDLLDYSITGGPAWNSNDRARGAVKTLNTISECCAPAILWTQNQP